ncbi:hypothetical protein Q2T48_33950, partial [Pseudomonas aeruginosa]
RPAGSLERLGLVLAPGYTLSKLLWSRRRFPELFTESAAENRELLEALGGRPARWNAWGWCSRRATRCPSCSGAGAAFPSCS